ncbi:MAG TPA: DUF411 domain-containing protein [Aquabacterium sp.]|nr:DUF411 domain-containing protein [Aquabacterium sp.]
MKTRFLLLFAVLAASFQIAQAGTAHVVDVFKNPYCGCCEKWVEHLRHGGFDVRVHEVEDTAQVRKQLDMPNQLASCHTAKIGEYVIEGHVPASDIVRLIKSGESAKGLAVPGMVMGSPGMEGPNAVPYDAILLKNDGSAEVYARH